MNPMLRAFRLIAVVVVLVCSVTPSAAAPQHWLVCLHRSPDNESNPAGVIGTAQPYVVLRHQDDWVLVKQGDVEGWARSSELEERPEARLPQLSELGLGSPPDPPTGPLEQQPGEFFMDNPANRQWTRGNALDGLLEFALGDREQLDKLVDPSYRDRVHQVSKRWGPLYSRATQLFYVRGLYLWQFDEDRFRFGLFKKRTYYERLYGDLWSDQAMDALLDSESGWRGNRELFGKGREYYLELSFHF